MRASAGKRILMLLENNAFPQDTRVRQEAKTLVAARFAVTVICPRSDGQSWQEVFEGVEVYRFPPPPEGNGFVSYLGEYGYAMVAVFLFSFFVFMRRGFDIVHTHNPPDTLVFIAAFYKLFGKRFIYDHHDLCPEMYQALFGASRDSLTYKVLVWLERISCRLADHVIATNGSYRELEMHRDQVPEEKITIVRNGPDLRYFEPVEPMPDLQRSGKQTLCYLGSMGFHDGVDYLLRALGCLKHDLGRCDFFCLLVGDGEARCNLEILLEKLGLDDCVHFTGRVAHSEVNRYLSAADICIAPEPSNSYNDRSTVIKLMEYMAIARPIVAFDLPEHRLTAGGAAVYARPNDEMALAQCISMLMDDPEQRRIRGQCGRARIETELAWQYQERYLLSAYRILLSADE